MIAEPVGEPAPESSLPPSPAESPGGGRKRTRSAFAVGLVLVGSLAGSCERLTLVCDGQADAALSEILSLPGVVDASVSGTKLNVAVKDMTHSLKEIFALLDRLSISISDLAVDRFTLENIVLDQNGDILTNAHVIAGANQIQVTFNDGRTVPGTVAGSNTNADLAVVKVSVAASSLHPLVLGNSDSVLIGDTAYALGAPFDLPESMTAGIISGLNRSNQGSGLTGLIQTDAPINPGNSGGALLNAAGQVIGVNDSIESPIQGNVGVGFAIPINAVKQLLGSLEGGANQ